MSRRPELAGLAGLAAGERRPKRPPSSASSKASSRSANGSGRSTCRADRRARRITPAATSWWPERDDLTEAIKRLRQAIQNLNQEGRERLLGAFDTVNKHFGDLFAALFEGGSGRAATDRNPTTRSRPDSSWLRGRRARNAADVTLLSGGEQALTAMALIFAVFLTNPRRSACSTRSTRPSTTIMSSVSATCWRRCASVSGHPLRHHHPQPDHHGAHGPAVSA